MGNKEVFTDALHAVSLKGFYIDRTEVTQREYRKAMKNNPSKAKSPDNPVERVAWSQAKKYCEMAGKRLPTEAEWEYAARAGTTTKFSFGNYSSVLMNYGNYCGGSCKGESLAGIGSENDGHSEIAPVKSFKSNSWGLHDMHGNVAEWVNDWYSWYRAEEMNNPTGPESGLEKVVRGGSWKSSESETASGFRDKKNPAARDDGIGFRCAADT